MESSQSRTSGITPFQFQYGTIISARYFGEQFIDLISIPVWYDYKNVIVPLCAVVTRFQFQYGTIISELLQDLASFFKLFQFQYGTIISTSFALRASIYTTFQFQYGTIIRIFPLTYSAHTEYISIPVWYDYKLIIYRPQHRQAEFQFQYGTIISV